MGFTAKEIVTFILAQTEELRRHERFLHEVYGSSCSMEEAAADWTRRYAEDYRYIGTLLMELLEPAQLTDLFTEGMSEIMRHKLFESQKAKFDIGLRSAGLFWIDAHAAKWLAEQKEKQKA